LARVPLEVVPVGVLGRIELLERHELGHDRACQMRFASSSAMACSAVAFRSGSVMAAVPAEGRSRRNDLRRHCRSGHRGLICRLRSGRHEAVTAA
jgi:hypothetical protein